MTTRLRDKSVLIKLIGSTLVSRHAGINRKASIDCRELFYAPVTWKFWNDCKHCQCRSHCSERGNLFRPAQSKRMSWTVASLAVSQKGTFLRFLDGGLGSSNGIPKALGRAADGA